MGPLMADHGVVKERKEDPTYEDAEDVEFVHSDRPVRFETVGPDLD